MIGRKAATIVVAGALLAACGGARSTSGTSAANCVAPLEHAIQAAPSYDQFRGLAQVDARGLEHFGFRPEHGVRAYCVVLFLDRTQTHRSHVVFEVWAFTERGARLLGHHERVHRGRALPDLA